MNIFTAINLPQLTTMRIVFGHSHFRIKKVQPHEVGLFDKEFDNVTFDLQQKYGHLYWIPFIPLGKIWTVNKGDGKKYVCHPEIEQMLNQNPGRSGKTSIFAWSGFLAIGLVLLFISLAEKVNHYNNEKSYTAQFKENSLELQDLLDSAAVNDYFIFTLKKSSDKYYNSASFPLKVLAVKNDEVLLGSFAAADNYNISVSDQHALIQFVQGTAVEDSFWVKMSLLKKGIPTDRSEENTFPGIQIPAYFAAGTFKLEEIKHLEGPEPEEDYNAPGKSATYFELVNYGFNAHADSLVPAGAGLSCKLSKERDFSIDSTIAIQLFGTGKYTLYCSDKKKQQYAYEIDNSANNLLITKLEF